MLENLCGRGMAVNVVVVPATQLVPLGPLFGCWSGVDGLAPADADTVLPGGVGDGKHSE